MSVKSEETVSLKSKREEAEEETISLKVPEDDYDPHKHRVVKHPTSNGETLVHLLKGSIGTGILAMPQAFHNAGLISGIINTAIIGFLCTYCLHVLIKAQYELCKRRRIPVLSYPDSMKMALESGPSWMKIFAPAAPLIINTFMIIYQLGICCVYIVFVAVNVKQMVDALTSHPLDLKYYMCLLLLPLVGMNCIRNLKLMAPFSTAANILTFIGMGMLMVYLFDDIPSISERDMIGILYNFPLYFGTTLFALEAVGVVIAIESNMKNPASFLGLYGVLNIAMFIVVVLYIFLGAVGYVKYGSEALGSVTLNLPENEILSQLIKFIFAISIFISYGLQCYVPVEIIWNTYIIKRLEGSTYKLIYEFALRIGLVWITWLLAMAVPRLGLFISLFGAFCLSAMGIVFPAIMEICVYWPEKLGKWNYILIKDVLLIIFGLLGLVTGTYTSLLEIVLSFQ